MNIQTGDDGSPARRRPTSRSCASSATSCAGAPSAPWSQSLRVGSRSGRVQSGLRRRRRFSFRQDINLGGVLRPVRHRRTSTDDNDSYLGRFEYAGDRYGAQARIPEGRRQLHPRSRLRPARQHPAQFRLAALQPAAGGATQEHSPVHLSGNLEYIENGAGQTRDTGRRRAFAGDARTATSSRWRRDELRAAAAAVHRARNVAIPPGGYPFGDVTRPYRSGCNGGCRERSRCSAESSTTAPSRAFGYTAARVSTPETMVGRA